ncbi:depupylase/deamidase Dop [Rothia sp. P6271]|uniref:depupylase/deamidase Dop n=1 Tax=Rothia sp. P6271 TaxID=3402659 RepID=UPI003ACCFBD7
MSVQRIIGAETEYGIIAPTHPHANPTMLSAEVVDTYNKLFRRELSAQNSSTIWEYDSETPLQDAYGHTQEEQSAHPSQLTHQSAVLTSEDIAAEALLESGAYAERLDPDAVTMNAILPNGARLYVDHAHPEYSSPETSSPRDAVLWDAAGDYLAARTIQTLEETAEETKLPNLQLYKNNTDSKGQSYGSHENYLIQRKIDFDELSEALLPFFATRQIMTGAGRVGIGTASEKPGYQISQRADFFERTIGLETTIRRPMINTRDEPHADSDKYRRLHVIIGDANLSHYSNLLKFGTTSLVLNLIENHQAPQIALADSVKAMHTVSHDLTLKQQLPLTNGRSLTAIEIQRLYLEAAQKYEQNPDSHTQEILDLWEKTLTLLETDLFALADTLDWVAKYQLIHQYVQKGVNWDNPKLQAIDLQYADIRPHKGLYYKLVQLGRMKTLFTPEQIAFASHYPPEDTRAYLRGTMIRRWPEEILSANWDTIVARSPWDTVVHRLRLDEPKAYTKKSIEHLLNVDNASTLIDQLNHEGE